MNTTYDLVKEVESFVNKFDTETVDIVSMPNLKGSKRKKYSNYSYNQKELIAKIDMAVLSQFETGHFDKDGKRKMYLNEVCFVRDVANKATDLDTKNFVFIPDGYSQYNRIATLLFSKQFKHFSKESGLANQMNDGNSKFNTYGTIVGKICGEKGEGAEVEIIPLQSLRNSMTAKSLKEGVEQGEMVIVERAYSFDQMKEYSGWTLPKKRFKGTKTFYEVYTMAPKSINKVDGKGDANELDFVLYMAIVAPDTDEKVHFIEEIDELPFAEEHDSRIEGRWLGRGEVEKQLENQIAKNFITNIKRRDANWASERRFVSKGIEDMPKNLAVEVEDGGVISVGMAGDMVQLDTASRGNNDVQMLDNIVSDNMKRISFAFESQTGETMPSGQRFRLGAMLSNASQGYFDQKKQKLGLFWKAVIYDLVIPEFKKTSKRDIEYIMAGEEGYSLIKELHLITQTNEYFTKVFLSKDYFRYNVPTYEEVQTQVEQQILKDDRIAVTDITNKIYDDAKWIFDIDITGESFDKADRETYITLWQTLSQQGDARAEEVLNVLMGTLGKNMQAIAGKKQQTPQQNMTAQNPNLQGLVPQQ